MQRVEKSSNFVRHIVSNFGSHFVPLAVALITIPQYLALVGQERFGIVSVILAFLIYLGFMDFGLGRAVARRVAMAVKDDAEGVSVAIWTGAISSMLLGGVGGVLLVYVGDYFMSAQVTVSEEMLLEAITALKYVALGLPFIISTPVYLGALNSTYHFRQANSISVLSNVSVQIAPLLCAMSGNLQIDYLVASVVIVKVVTNFTLFVVCVTLGSLTLRPAFEIAELRILLPYGGWVSIISLMTPLLTTVDRLFIASLAGVKLVTSYVLPYDLVTKLLVISSSFSNALFPRLVGASPSEIAQLTSHSTKLLMAVITPLIIIGILLMGPFLEFWAGADIAASAHFVPEILLLGLWINALVIPTYTNHLANFDPKVLVAMFSFQIPVYFLLLYFGVKHFGIIGAALAWTTRIFIDTTMILVYHSKLLSVLMSNKYFFLLVLSALLVKYMEPNILLSITVCFVFLLACLATQWGTLTKVYQEMKKVNEGVSDG